MAAMTDRLLAFKARFEQERHLRALDQQGRSFGAALPPRDASTASREPSPLEGYFDAHTEGHGIWKWRHYFDAYHRHLAKFRGRPVTVVEIGIYSGGSLGMWRDYFGIDCTVIGVDIEPACLTYESEHVRVFIGDQADPGFWSRFRREVSPVDVVIDDGGHQAHQQIATFEGLIKHMNPGGVYICEDVVGEENGFAHYLSGFARNLHHHDRVTTPFQRTIESVHLYPFVTVVEIPEQPLGELEDPKHGTIWQPFLNAQIDALGLERPAG